MTVSSLDPELLRTLLLVAIAVVLVTMVAVLRYVQKLITRFVMLVVLAAVGLSLWVQRADLQDCVDTCSCRLYGVDIEIPADQNPRCS